MTITPERLAELVAEAKKLLLFGTKPRKDYFVRHLAREMLVLTKQDPELPQVWHGDLTDMVGDLLLRDATEGLHVGPLGAARKRVSDLEAENARLREAANRERDTLRRLLCRHLVSIHAGSRNYEKALAIAEAETKMILDDYDAHRALGWDDNVEDRTKPEKKEKKQ